MPTTVLFEQTAFAHRDAGSLCHQCIGILDRSVALRVFQFLVAIAADTVELQQPVAETAAGIDLARPHFIGLRIPGNHRLGARTTRGSTNTQDVVERVLSRHAPEADLQAAALAQHIGRQGNQRINLDSARGLWLRPLRGDELQCTHATRAHVAETLDGVEAFRPAALRRQPGIDQGVAETIRQ